VYRRKKETDSGTDPLNPPELFWAELAQTLPPTELDLFRHYLEHTSRDRTVGDQDRYALQVGIPNLARQCKPLMRSVLALAAVCKCCDLINQPPSPVFRTESSRSEIIDLLSRAHGYHLESLREIQATLCEPKNYDHILANAAMMGMYGSASHGARIWLAKTARPGDDRQRFDLMMMPGNPQWLGFFRAVRLAYAGLLKNPNSPQPSPGSSTSVDFDFSLQYHGSKPGPHAPVDDVSSSTAIITSHPLGPILAATVGSALARVNEKASEVQATHGTDPELQACFTALAIFNDIVAKSLLDDASPSCAPSFPKEDVAVLERDDPVVGQQLAEISPWLRRYTASISSMVPSRLPRRLIMSFVHKVPSAYLDLIENMIGVIDDAGPPSPSTTGGGPRRMPEPSIAHQLAVEIFANWLVLVILLDNVWWIGGIGAWELGRFVSVRRYPGWEACLWNRDADWWPESMLEVSRQFDKHR
jgi:hypothetical protein